MRFQRNDLLIKLVEFDKRGMDNFERAFPELKKLDFDTIYAHQRSTASRIRIGKDLAYTIRNLLKEPNKISLDAYADQSKLTPIDNYDMISNVLYTAKSLTIRNVITRDIDLRLLIETTADNLRKELVRYNQRDGRTKPVNVNVYVNVLLLLCSGLKLVEVSTQLGIARQQVFQIRQKMMTFESMKMFRKHLRGLCV